MSNGRLKPLELHSVKREELPNVMKLKSKRAGIRGAWIICRCKQNGSHKMEADILNIIQFNLPRNPEKLPLTLFWTNSIWSSDNGIRADRKEKNGFRVLALFMNPSWEAAEFKSPENALSQYGDSQAPNSTQKRNYRSFFHLSRSCRYFIHVQWCVKTQMTPTEAPNHTAGESIQFECTEATIRLPTTALLV